MRLAHQAVISHSAKETGSVRAFYLVGRKTDWRTVAMSVFFHLRNNIGTWSNYQELDCQVNSGSPLKNRKANTGCYLVYTCNITKFKTSINATIKENEHGNSLFSIANSTAVENILG